ncbi:hypothetical protein ACLMJK_003333 [Lecanora helva]
MSTPWKPPDTKVCDMLRRYRPTRMLHPVVSKMQQMPGFKQMFWQCLEHDLHVIRDRSQILAEGEITTAQKAFRILMDEEENGLAAIDLYVSKIIGLDVVSDAKMAGTLAAALQTRNIVLNQSSQPSTTHAYNAHCSNNRDNVVSQQHDSEGLFVSESGSQTSSSSGYPQFVMKQEVRPAVYHGLEDSMAKKSACSNHDKMVQRLLATYQKAKWDFEATPFKSLERTKSAKFLRDTTENYLNYIAQRQLTAQGQWVFDAHGELLTDSDNLSEMRAILQTATEAAEEGSGGKKRRFDEDWIKVPEESSFLRLPSSRPSGFGRDPVPCDAKREPGKRIDHSQQGDDSLQRFHPSRVQHRTRHNRVKKIESQGIIPASTAQSICRVFPVSAQHYAKRTSRCSLTHGDCYRPKYK